MRWTKTISVLACGAACALLSAVVPVAMEARLPEVESKPAASVVRLPDTPAGYPDPNVTWVKGRIGLLREHSIRGIGIEDSWHVERMRAGWPLLMLEGSNYYEFHATGGKRASAEMHTVMLLQWHGDQRLWRFPLRPLWLQVAGNLLFWTLVCGGIAWSVPAGRRWVRRRKGRCEGCGYPAANQGRCPECGAIRA